LFERKASFNRCSGKEQQKNEKRKKGEEKKKKKTLSHSPFGTQMIYVYHQWIL
jgi:hypothetical protein